MCIFNRKDRRVNTRKGHRVMFGITLNYFSVSSACTCSAFLAVNSPTHPYSIFLQKWRQVIHWCHKRFFNSCRVNNHTGHRVMFGITLNWFSASSACTCSASSAVNSRTHPYSIFLQEWIPVIGGRNKCLLNGSKRNPAQ